MNKTPFEALDLNIAHIPPLLRGLNLFLISDWGSFANLKIKEVKKAARVANGSIFFCCRWPCGCRMQCRNPYFALTWSFSSGTQKRRNKLRASLGKNYVGYSLGRWKPSSSIMHWTWIFLLLCASRHFTKFRPISWQTMANLTKSPQARGATRVVNITGIQSDKDY